jgi:hypothetical protein
VAFCKRAYYFLGYLIAFNPSLILDTLIDCPLDNQSARMESNVEGWQLHLGMAREYMYNHPDLPVAMGYGMRAKHRNRFNSLTYPCYKRHVTPYPTMLPRVSPVYVNCMTSGRALGVYSGLGSVNAPLLIPHIPFPHSIHIYLLSIFLPSFDHSHTLVYSDQHKQSIMGLASKLAAAQQGGGGGGGAPYGGAAPQQQQQPQGGGYQQPPQQQQGGYGGQQQQSSQYGQPQQGHGQAPPPPGGR